MGLEDDTPDPCKAGLTGFIISGNCEDDWLILIRLSPGF